MAEVDWAARLDAAQARLVELQAELDARDAMQQASASQPAPPAGRAQKAAASASRVQGSYSPGPSPGRLTRPRLSPHTSPQAAAAAVAAAAASEAASASVVAARAALLAETSAAASAELAGVASPPLSPGRLRAPIIPATDETVLLEKQAQLEAALVRAKQMGGLLQSRGAGLKAEVRQAKAAQAAAEAVAQAKDDLLQARQRELAAVRAELERTREDLTASQVAQAHLQTECQSLQVRFAEQLSKQQRLASDAVGARAEVSALKAEMSQLKNNEMMQRAISAFATGAGEGGPTSPGANRALSELRHEANALATELSTLKEARRIDKESQARLIETCNELRSENARLTQENTRLAAAAVRSEAAQQQMQQVLQASRRLQDALSSATTSSDALRTRCAAAERDADAQRSIARRLEEENTTLREEIKTVVTQVEQLVRMQHAASSESPHSGGGLTGALGMGTRVPSSGASAAGPSEPHTAKVSGDVSEQCRRLEAAVRTAQAELQAGYGSAAGREGATHIEDLRRALHSALDELRQQQQAATRASMIDSAAAAQDKARLAAVSAELAAKTTEVVRHRADLERAAAMMEDSRLMQAKLAEQLQRATHALHLVASQGSLPPSPSPGRNTSPPTARHAHAPTHTTAPPPHTQAYQTTGLNPHQLGAGGLASGLGAGGMSSRVDTSRLAQTQYASPRGGGSAHVEAVGVRRDGLGGSGALRGGGDVGRGGVGQVVQTQTQGAGPQSYGTQESEEDMNALLEYMEQELAMLSGGLADREAVSKGLLARMAAVKKSIIESTGSRRPVPGPMSDHSGTVPAVWEARSDSQYGATNATPSPRGGAPHVFPAAPTSGQCSPDAYSAHATFTTSGVTVAAAGGGGGGGGVSSGAVSGRPPSAWGTTGSAAHSRHDSQTTTLLHESHSTYTVPSAPSAGTRTGGGSGRVGADGAESLDVSKVLADAESLLAVAGGRAGGGGGGGVAAARSASRLSLASEFSSSTINAAQQVARRAAFAPTSVGAVSSNHRDDENSLPGLRMLRTYQSIASRHDDGGAGGGGVLDRSASMARSVAGVDNALAALQTEDTYTD